MPLTIARFLFISESEDYTDELFKDPYIQKHSKVAAVRKVFGPEEHFINFGYNFFKPGTLIPTLVWSPRKIMKSRNIIFTPTDDFQGFQFDVKQIIFSCEGAALEVLMSVCLSVCLCVRGQVENLRFQKAPKGSYRFIKVP